MNVFLGQPTESEKRWILENRASAGHADTWYKYANDTEWRTVGIQGEIAIVNDIGETG